MYECTHQMCFLVLSMKWPLTTLVHKMSLTLPSKCGNCRFTSLDEKKFVWHFSSIYYAPKIDFILCSKTLILSKWMLYKSCRSSQGEYRFAYNLFPTTKGFRKKSKKLVALDFWILFETVVQEKVIHYEICFLARSTILVWHTSW